MPIRRFGIPLLLTTAVGLAACSGLHPQAPSFNHCEPGNCPDASVRPGGTGSQSGEVNSSSSANDSGALSWLFNFNGNSQNGGGTSMAVNAFLWRGALDTISFMPLASADPFGGVIITDWYSPPSSPDERFKASVFILGRDLRSNNLRISIFRQVRQDGQWVDAAVSPETVNDLEDKVLARARQLRVESKS